MKQEIDYEFETDETIPCRIREGWAYAGRTGQYFGNMIVKNIKWAIVLWDGSEDPDFHKAEGIEVTKNKWVRI